MRKDLRIGCVGTSSIMEIIVDSLHRVEGLEPAVVYSRDEARGRAFAQKNGIPESCADYRQMLERPDLDVIYIASPNALHASQAVEALEAGKDVIVEKPAGVTAAEVDAMQAAAEKNGVYFLEAITTIFMPCYLWMKERLPRLGELREVRLAYGQYSSKYDAYLRGENPNIFNPAMKAGALNDMGIYCIHAAVDLFGEPASVAYEPECGPNGIDLAGELLLGYPGQEVKILTAKNKDPEGGSGCRITGANGWLRQEGPFNEFGNCAASIGGQEESAPIPAKENRMVYEHTAFRDCILNRDKAFFERMVRQSRACAKILEAAHA